MTAITDVTTMVEAALGRTLQGSQLAALGEAFFIANPVAYGDYATRFVDPENPTSEELARLVKDSTIDWWKNVLGTGAAVKQETIDYITAEKNAARSNLE